MNLSTNGNQQPGQNKVVQTMRSRIYDKVEENAKNRLGKAKELRRR